MYISKQLIIKTIWLVLCWPVIARNKHNYDYTMCITVDVRLHIYKLHTFKMELINIKKINLLALNIDEGCLF